MAKGEAAPSAFLESMEPRISESAATAAQMDNQQGRTIGPSNSNKATGSITTALDHGPGKRHSPGIRQDCTLGNNNHGQGNHCQKTIVKISDFTFRQLITKLLFVYSTRILFLQFIINSCLFNT